ncbi:MAG: MerR family transcriptional regulator [Anaerolineales bacterium]|jgi:effector-binding domain-containing protein
MIRIGDFSKLSRVTVKTLRYYDEVGLLKPAHVDNFTGYRHYTYEQLPRLNRILALKDLGFSLEEIGQLLAEDLAAKQMRGMLKLRQSEIKRRVQDERERLARVEVRLRQIEQEDVMSKYIVVIKSVEPLKVAALRGIVPTPPDQGRLWNELESYLARQHVQPAGPCLSLYHDEEYKEVDWDIEVCEPIEGDLPETERVKVRQLADTKTMACVVHQGPFITISEAYEALIKWIGENGYQIVGPGREVYLREAKEGDQNDPDTLTEVQFPVKKG